MMEIIESILQKSGDPDLLERLTRRLSASTLNTLLLEVFRQKAAALTPADLLRAYEQNRFVQPAAVDAVAFSEFILEWLKTGRAAGFQPLELSPLSPLGACSVVASVHQHKVLSALRGTEVTADATNILALESVVRRKTAGFPAENLDFCAAHRHVRTQTISVPGFTPHFAIFCLTSAGRDAGHFRFEIEQLRRHLQFYWSFLTEQMGIIPSAIRLMRTHSKDAHPELFPRVFDALRALEPDWPIEEYDLYEREQPYYKGIQFKIMLKDATGRQYDIADGGFTDWTQQLSGNRKERFMSSGVGVELLFKRWKG
jgi:hypothetical protein